MITAGVIFFIAIFAGIVFLGILMMAYLKKKRK